MLRFFKLEEFDCQETGENRMDMDFLLKLDALRAECGFPFRITSGYRSESHSIEARKEKPGQHTRGIACDIAVDNGAQRMILVQKALEAGFTGVGIHKSFTHLDTRDSTPVMWVY